VRGRTRFALALIGFVVVATGVIWRRSFGVVRAREQQRLEQQRGTLEAERAKLQRDIRDASSREKLERVAEERLHMHLPSSDSQVIFLKRPPKPRAKE
jgi:cell division protein FtsL